MARKADDTARRIISSHKRGQFFYPQFARTEPRILSKRFPVALTVDGEPCGCRFGFADGFKHRCDTHKEIVAGISAARKSVKPSRFPFVEPRYVDAVYVAPKPPKGFHAELHARYEAQDAARKAWLLEHDLNPRKVRTLADVPATLRKNFSAFMADFSVTQEQVVTELRPSKKVPR